MKARILVLALAVLLAAALPSSAEEFEVIVQSNTFSPANLTIQVGDTVTWRNQSGNHNVAADDLSFRCANGCDGDGGDGNPSAAAWSFSLTFDDPGSIPYHCQVHGGPNGAGMSGVLTVEGDDEPPPPDVPTNFNSGFEVDNFGDWDDRFCPSCNSVVAFLGANKSASPAPSYRTNRPGLHRAQLAGPSDTEFDLALERWEAGVWQVLATSESPGPDEEIRYAGGPGRYRWVVTSREGYGNFRLTFHRPASHAADPNELRQSAAAKRKGQNGLESAYVAGSSNKDYLVDLLELDATRYDISFLLRPAADLLVKGKKTIILQLRGAKDVAHLRLLPPLEEGGDFLLQLRARSGSRLRTIGEMPVKPGKFVKVRLVWEAASEDGAADGRVRLFRKRKVMVEAADLDNDADRVRELRFGQVSKSKRGTEGVASIDVLKTKFSE